MKARTGRGLLRALLSLAFICASDVHLIAQEGVASFHINIPRKLSFGSTASGPPIEIMRVVTTVMVIATPGSTTSGVTFTITDPASGSTGTVTVTPGGSGVLHTFDPLSGFTCPMFQICQNNVFVTPPATAGDNEYTLTFHLLTYYNPPDCGSRQSTDVQFRIDIDSAHRMIGVCTESFDAVQRPLGGMLSCTTNNLTAISPGECSGGATSCVATVPEAVGSSGCISRRPAVNAVLVLDRSGSMQDPASSGSSQTKIESLRIALKSFVDTWIDVHNLDAMMAPPVSAPNDSLGVVLFDSLVDWWGVLPNRTPPNVLNPVDLNLRSIIDSSANLNTITPRGATAIGQGLLEAVCGTTALPCSSPIFQSSDRHVVLLMTDGLQNVPPMVSLNDPANPTTILLDGSPFPNPSNIQFYSATVGTGMAADEALVAGIARASGGFHVNTETDTSLMPLIFQEILQNFLKLQSYETVRSIRDQVSAPNPYTTEFPISTTSRNVEFNLTWPQQLGPMRLTVIPPGGVPSQTRAGQDGVVTIAEVLPLAVPFDVMKNWKVLVESLSQAAQDIPFTLHVMTDDAAIHTDLSIVPSDYRTGDKILLRAKLTQFGSPILAMGTLKGDVIQAELERPARSIGDILSESTASAQGPACVTSSPCDQKSPAEAKLANTLKMTPLVHHKETVRLFDDGRPEHGDDVAGDGIYSGIYVADTPGNYNFLFNVERVNPGGVRFARQQLRTAYVRPFPDGGNTDIQASIISRGTLQIIMTPRGVSGDRLGPGWANYFWFTAPGVTPFKAHDNLDGTYTATMNFTGRPPRVSVHFENVLAVIGDSVTPDHLPQPLDSNNVLVDNIPVLSKWAAFLDLGGAFPHGTLGNVFNPGFSLNAGLDYMINGHFSVEGIFGYHHFPGKVSGDLGAYQFSGNTKFYLVAPQKFRPFVNGGIGAYKLSPGSGNFGGNFGGGLLYELTSRFGLQASYNFHAVNTSGGATKFSTIQGGIRFVF